MSICRDTQTARQNQCHPSKASIAKRLRLARNTVAKHIRLLKKQGLIVTEHTEIITKHGIKKNGNLLYAIIPMCEVIEQFYEHQLHELKWAEDWQKAQKKLMEQASA